VLIFRAVKKLEDAITVAYALPGISRAGLAVSRLPAVPRFVRRIPSTASATYIRPTPPRSKLHGKVYGTGVVDTKTRRIVNNESSEIIRMLNSEFLASWATIRTFIQHTCP